MKNTDERANQRANQIRWLEKEEKTGFGVGYMYRASRELAISSLLSPSGSTIGPDRPTVGHSETT